MRKVKVRTDGCIEWIGSKSGDGYGRWDFLGHPVQAHRLAYEWALGPIPDGTELDHTCRFTSCINPLHLEPVTHRVNVLRGQGIAAMRARQTHCVNGHEFTEENTYRFRGNRLCRACHLVYGRESKARMKQKARAA
jgi:hypothetical protein